MKTTEQAKSFIKKYGVSSISYNEMEEIINQLGFKIRKYDSMSGSSMQLLDKLKLRDYALTKNCFAYSCGNLKLVFIKDFISANNGAALLLHEIGHIVMGHISDTGLVDENIQYEEDANEFAFTVKTQLARNKSIRKVKTAIASVFAVALSATIFFTGYKLLMPGNNASSDSGITDSSSLPEISQNDNTSSETAEEDISSQEAESKPETTTTEPKKPKTTTTTTAIPSTTIPPETAQPYENGVEEVYYVTKSGTKYHTADCYYVSNRATIALPLSGLEELGYTPCSHCIR